MCVIEPVEPYEVPFPDGLGDAGLERALSKPSRRAPFQVVHLSDLHIDPQYAVRLYLL